MGGMTGSTFGSAKGKEQTSSRSADVLASLAESFAGESGGIRQGLIKAMQEVLATGGSKIPIISRAVEASRQAGSKALTGTKEELAQQGLSGTPFGANVVATSRREGDISAGQTKQSLAQAIFNMIPNFVLGQSQTALSGLAGAIPGTLTTNAKGRTFGQSQTFGGQGSIGGGAKGG